MDEREKSGVNRNDLIDTLVTLRNEDKDKVYSPTNIVFQGDVLVAQSAIFFSAGFETSASMMSFGLFELCRRVKYMLFIVRVLQFFKLWIILARDTKQDSRRDQEHPGCLWRQVNIRIGVWNGVFGDGDIR